MPVTSRSCTRTSSLFHIVSGILGKGNLLPGLLNGKIGISLNCNWEVHVANALIQVLPACEEKQPDRPKPC